MAGEPFVRGQVGERGAVVRLQRGRVVARGGDVVAADTRGLERRRGIVGGAVDRGAQRRWCLHHLELVVGRDIEQPGLAREVDQAEGGVAVPRHHLGIRLRVVLRELIEHGADRGRAVGWQRQAVLLADLTRELDHLLLGRLDDRPRVVEQLRCLHLEVEVVLERPVVLGGADGVAVGGVGRFHRVRAGLEERVGDESAELPVGRARIASGGADVGEPRVAPRSRRNALGGDRRQRLAEVRCVGVAGVQAIAFEHAAIGDIARLHARFELRACGSEKRRDGLHALDDQRPFLGCPVAALTGLGEPLELPVDGAERFADVGVDGAFLVAAHLVLMQQEAHLRHRHVTVDHDGRRQRVDVDGAEAARDNAEPLVLVVDRGLRVVAQSAVHRRQRRVEPRATEVGVRGRIAFQEFGHVARERLRDERVAGAGIAVGLGAWHRAAARDEERQRHRAGR